MPVRRSRRDGQPTDADPLEGHGILAHWSFAYDYDDDHGGGYARGQLLLRDDGVMLLRHGGSFSSAGATRWRYPHPWKPVWGWTPIADVDGALRTIMDRGYSVAEVDPTPWDATESGPVDGIPPNARYLRRPE